MSLITEVLRGNMSIADALIKAGEDRALACRVYTYAAIKAFRDGDGQTASSLLQSAIATNMRHLNEWQIASAFVKMIQTPSP